MHIKTHIIILKDNDTHNQVNTKDKTQKKYTNDK